MHASQEREGAAHTRPSTIMSLSMLSGCRMRMASTEAVTSIGGRVLGSPSSLRSTTIFWSSMLVYGFHDHGILTHTALPPAYRTEFSPTPL